MKNLTDPKLDPKESIEQSVLVETQRGAMTGRLCVRFGRSDCQAKRATRNKAKKYHTGMTMLI
jgi:hypothetical protein